MNRRDFLKYATGMAVTAAAASAATVVAMSGPPPSRAVVMVIKDVKRQCRLARRLRVRHEALRQTLFAKDSRVYLLYAEYGEWCELAATADRPCLVFPDTTRAADFAGSFRLFAEGVRVYARPAHWTK